MKWCDEDEMDKYRNGDGLSKTTEVPTDEVFQVPDITKKLGEISLVMSDGYQFMKMRMYAEGCELYAHGTNHSEEARKTVKLIKEFHELCQWIKESK